MTFFDIEREMFETIYLEIVGVKEDGSKCTI